MTTLFSKRRRLIIAAAIILFAVIICWFIFSSRPSGTLTISFTRMEYGRPRAAVFGITNSSRHLVILESVKVQTLENGSSSNRVGHLRVDYYEGDTLRRNGGFGAVFLTNGYQKMKITGVPEAGPWRVCLQYSEQRVGLDAFFSKLRLAISRRQLTLPKTISLWRRHTLLSATITNAPPEHN